MYKSRFIYHIEEYGTREENNWGTRLYTMYHDTLICMYAIIND